MPGRQLLMTFPVTATSHTLADYRARGGYETLREGARDGAAGRHQGSRPRRACSATAAPRSRSGASGAS